MVIELVAFNPIPQVEEGGGGGGGADSRRPQIVIFIDESHISS